MKDLKSFENELNKCSKCGLCESVCPIFKINPNECTVSKGKFIMLNGVTKGELKLSKNINKYLDMCLKCGKCTEFCPSGIDAVQIFNTAKYEYTKKTLLGKLKFKIPKFFNRKLNLTQENTDTIMYFRGCVNKILPNTDKYLKKIFKNIPINIITPNFECCGLPYLSEGNMEEFLKSAEYNLSLIKGDFKYLVTDCASCEDTILSYKKYLPNFEFQENKSVNWGDIIAEKNIKFIFKKHIKITFHKPCHLNDDTFFEKIINNCQNVEYVKMENYDNCCGCAGSFIIKNRELSKKLSEYKAENIINTNANCVLTTCPACILGLKQGLIQLHSNIKVMSILEFLSKADEIKY